MFLPVAGGQLSVSPEHFWCSAQKHTSLPSEQVHAEKRRVWEEWKVSGPA